MTLRSPKVTGKRLGEGTVFRDVMDKGGGVAARVPAIVVEGGGEASCGAGCARLVPRMWQAC